MRTNMKTRINFLLITISTLLLISCSDNREPEINTYNNPNATKNTFEQPKAKFTYEISRPLTVTLSLPYQSETSISIDWGDGTTENKYRIYNNISHKYKGIGVYKITLTLGKYDENGYYHTDKHQEIVTVEAPTAKYLTEISFSQYSKPNTYMVFRISEYYDNNTSRYKIYYFDSEPKLLSDVNTPYHVKFDSPIELNYKLNLNPSNKSWFVEVFYETTKNGTKNKLNTLLIKESDLDNYPEYLYYDCNDGNKYFLYFDYK